MDHLRQLVAHDSASEVQQTAFETARIQRNELIRGIFSVVPPPDALAERTVRADLESGLALAAMSLATQGGRNLPESEQRDRFWSSVWRPHFAADHPTGLSVETGDYLVRLARAQYTEEEMRHIAADSYFPEYDDVPGSTELSKPDIQISTVSAVTGKTEISYYRSLHRVVQEWEGIAYDSHARALAEPSSDA